MNNQRRKVWEKLYICLFSDRTIGLSDGVGYLDTLPPNEVKELYLEIGKLFKGANNNE